MATVKLKRITKSVRRARDERNELNTLEEGEVQNLHNLFLKQQQPKREKVNRCFIKSYRRYTIAEKKLMVLLRFGSLDRFDRVAMSYREIVKKLGSITMGTILTVIRIFTRNHFDLNFPDGRSKGNRNNKIILDQEIEEFMRSHQCLRNWAVYSLP